jgi:hypothetical protein
MITVRIESRDGKGDIVGLLETPAQSLVHNFMRNLKIQAEHVAGSVQTIAGNWVSIAPTEISVATAAVGEARRGIVVGSIPSPVNLLQSTLLGIISHGTVGGQLLYQAVTVVAPSGTTSVWSFQLSRVFLNRSGVAATISEIGLYVSFGASTIMVDRTVPPSPVVVPDQGQITIVYTFKGTLG